MACLDPNRGTTENRLMSRGETDNCLAGLDEPKRSTFELLRRSILDVVPDADRGVSCPLPASRVQGNVAAAPGACSQHCGTPGDVWVHSSVIDMPGVRDLSAGQAVEFRYELGHQDSWRYRATRVRPLPGPASRETAPE